jgi:hypothetical protein
MGSVRGTSFTKTRGRPPSQDLLRNHSSEFPSDKPARINFDLASCDSCAAKLHFRFNYPPAAEVYQAAEVSRYLLSLAEGLLVPGRPRVRALPESVVERGDTTVASSFSHVHFYSRGKFGEINSAKVFSAKHITWH